MNRTIAQLMTYPLHGFETAPALSGLSENSWYLRVNTFSSK